LRRKVFMKGERYEGVYGINNDGAMDCKFDVGASDPYRRKDGDRDGARATSKKVCERLHEGVEFTVWISSMAETRALVISPPKTFLQHIKSLVAFFPHHLCTIPFTC
jgi:hypothetical protein